MLGKILNPIFEEQLNTLIQHNATAQGSTNHNYTALNHILDHVCLNSRLSQSIVCTSAKGTSHGENNILRCNTQSSGEPFHIIRDLSIDFFSI